MRQAMLEGRMSISRSPLSFLLLLFSVLSANGADFTRPVAPQVRGYGTYKRACVEKGVLQWEAHSIAGELNWREKIVVVVEASSSWFMVRHNFYHM